MDAAGGGITSAESLLRQLSASWKLCSIVECVFTPREDGTTLVSTTNDGFAGNEDELVTQVTDSVQGVTLVLAGLKGLLDHNLRLNLVTGRYPRGIEHP